MELQLADEIKEHPKFGSLQVFGTASEPLFTVAQVARLIGQSLRVDRSYLESGLDYVRKVVPRQNGSPIEQILLTESGLYNVIFRSMTLTGREFRIFITSVLRDLRTRDNTVNMIIELAEFDVKRTGEHLYMISDGKWTKIGRSSDIPRRLQDLQTANPRLLRIHHEFTKMGHLEHDVHERAGNFGARRGEWFLLGDRSDELAEWIRTI